MPERGTGLRYSDSESNGELSTAQQRARCQSEELDSVTRSQYINHAGYVPAARLLFAL
ncbi:hypothetical protein J6590_044837 [Homalodisca vitripennis]|nr:hypothetical protein J6590_044837 [Homalodisca vitripennis]